MENKVDELVCGCGKTPQEHLNKEILTYHHYWYFHKNFIPDCEICKLTYSPLMKNVLISYKSYIENLTKNMESHPLNITAIDGIKIIESSVFPFTNENGQMVCGVIYGSDGIPIWLIDVKND